MHEECNGTDPWPPLALSATDAVGLRETTRQPVSLVSSSAQNYGEEGIEFSSRQNERAVQSAFFPRLQLDVCHRKQLNHLFLDFAGTTPQQAQKSGSAIQGVGLNCSGVWLNFAPTLMPLLGVLCILAAKLLIPLAAGHRLRGERA